ncbi:hypothetical protein AVEN_103093-1, partial [Araneus ventricosus]
MNQEEDEQHENAYITAQ